MSWVAASFCMALTAMLIVILTGLGSAFLVSRAMMGLAVVYGPFLVLIAAPILVILVTPVWAARSPHLAHQTNTPPSLAGRRDSVSASAPITRGRAPGCVRSRCIVRKLHFENLTGAGY
jgi:hypothetical protein